MPRKRTEPEADAAPVEAEAQPTAPVISEGEQRYQFREALRVRARALAWDPDDLRAFLLDLIDAIAQTDR